MEESFKLIYQAVLEGDRDTVREQVKSSLEAGGSPEVILNKALVPAMDRVGELFEEREYYVPEMLTAAHAMQAGMDLLRPLLMGAEIEPVGKIAMGTVLGDLHDIGKNLVSMMLEGAGFEVLDLGVDVPPERFIEVVRTDQVNILGLSALLTTTMASMQLTIEAIHAAGLRDRVKIMIGGAPVTQEFANKVGADGYASDATQAVKLAKSLAR